MKPLVSVVLPTFNRCSLVTTAIDSVLAQQGVAFELIVVDDGSTDDTANLLRSYGGRLRLLRQAHQGVSAARNTGIRVAAGALIALIDSDDYWLPDKLTTQAAFFREHPTALICQTEEIWERNGRRVNPGLRHRKYGGWIFTRTLPLCLVSPSAVMIKKTLLDKVGLFDESLPACEDYDLWLRISRKYPIHLIATPLVVKRGGHADQLSLQPGLDRYRIQALCKIIRQGCLTDEQEAAARRVLEEKCRIYANGCEKRGRAAEAAAYRRLGGKAY